MQKSFIRVIGLIGVITVIASGACFVVFPQAATLTPPQLETTNPNPLEPNLTAPDSEVNVEIPVETDEQPNFDTESEMSTVESARGTFQLADWTYREVGATELVLEQYIGKATSIYLPGVVNSKHVTFDDFSIFPSNMTALVIEAIDGTSVRLNTADGAVEAFYFNETIQSLDLSGLDVSRVTSFSKMFYYASKLTTLDLTAWDTTNVNDISSMFYGTSNLSRLDVSTWDTSNVTNMSEVFHYAFKLKTLDLSQWDTSSVTTMKQMFKAASGLTTLNLSNFDTSSVTDMEGMFDHASSLTSLDLSNWDTSNVITLRNTFSTATELATLNVSTWNTSNVTDLYYTFSQTKNLSALDVSNWDTSKVDCMQSTFKEVGVTQLDVSGWDTSNVTTMTGMFGGAPNLISLDISQWDTSNVTDMSAMFSWTANLVSLEVSAWNTSNVTTMRDMFEEAASLITVDVSTWDTSNVTDMQGLFQHTYKLDTLDVSEWNTSKVKSFSAMFKQTNLSALDVSKWDTSNVTTMSSMFYYAQSLETLDVSGWDTSKLTSTFSLYEIFHRTDALKFLDLRQWHIPQNVKLRNFVTKGATAPFAILTTDDQLLNYAYEDYNIAPYPIWLRLLGATFSNGDEQHNANSLIAITSLDELLANLQFISPENPIGYQFEAWTQINSNPATMADYFEPYYPVWQQLEGVLWPKGLAFDPLKAASFINLEGNPVTLTASHVLRHNVDSTVMGHYEVVYGFTTVEGDYTEVKVPVEVGGNQPPQLIATDVEVLIDQAFDPLAHVQATDDSDETLTIQVKENTVDPTQAGVYHVTYYVEDSEGLSSTLTIQVRVRALPTLTTSDIRLTVGTPFDPLKYVTATDVVEGDLTPIVAVNEVDTTQQGVYHVTYQATNNVGGTTTRTITVTVVPVVADVTVPTVPATFAINPNLPSDEQFVATTFQFENNMYVPVHVDLVGFNQTTELMQDVLPTAHDRWDLLNVTDSKDLALAVQPTAGEGWSTLITGPRYVKDLVAGEVGTIQPHQAVSFTFTAKHGVSFPATLAPRYQLVFVFDF